MSAPGETTAPRETVRPSASLSPVPLTPEATRDSPTMAVPTAATPTRFREASAPVFSVVKVNFWELAS